MNLFADEDVDQPIVDRLRQDGHVVVCAAEVSPSVSDDEILRQANDQNALLITADKDFGELVFRQRRMAWRRHSVAVVGHLCQSQGKFGGSGDPAAECGNAGCLHRDIARNGAYPAISVICGVPPLTAGRCHVNLLVSPSFAAGEGLSIAYR